MLVLGHMLKHVFRHVLEHVTGHMLEHVTGHMLENVPKHVLVRHVLGLNFFFSKFIFNAKTVFSFFRTACANR